MKKILSFLGRRYDPPSSLEIQAIIRRFTRIEQVVFFFFALLFSVSIIGLVWGTLNAFSKEVPTHRGTWREGVVGLPHVINPVLAVSDADRDLVALIYAGLMRPDGKGRLTTNLADRYTISEDGLLYTFFLKENLRWHDGERLTADDIAFTVALAKNPVLKSPLRANWEGVSVEVKNEKEIEFRLEQPYAPFLENTTLGILPKHLWEETPVEQFTLSKFNTEPVGAGPYVIKNINRNSSGIVTKYFLRAFDDYALGEPFITLFEFRFYASEQALFSAFNNKEINSIAGLSPQNFPSINTTGTALYSLTVPRVFGVFFNQNKKDVFSKPEIREALERAISREPIIKEIFNGFAEPIFSPIPPGTFSAIDIKNEFSFISTSSPEEALLLMKKNGWSYDTSEKTDAPEPEKKTYR